MNSYFALKKKWLMDAVARTAVLLFAFTLYTNDNYQLNASADTIYTTPFSATLEYVENRNINASIDIYNLCPILPESVEYEQYSIDDNVDTEIIDVVATIPTNIAYNTYSIDNDALAEICYIINTSIDDEILYRKFDIDSLSNLDLIYVIEYDVDNIVYDKLAISNEYETISTIEFDFLNTYHEYVNLSCDTDLTTLQSIYHMDLKYGQHKVEYQIEISTTELREFESPIILTYRLNDVEFDIDFEYLPTYDINGLDAKISSRYYLTASAELMMHELLDMSMYLNIYTHIDEDVTIESIVTNNLSSIMLYNIIEDFNINISLHDIETLDATLTYDKDVNLSATMELGRIRQFRDLNGLEFEDLDGLIFADLYMNN